MISPEATDPDTDYGSRVTVLSIQSRHIPYPMELSLTRGDLLQLDPISRKGTLRLLPIGKKKKQKLVVGDDSGHIGCYKFKKGEPQVVFTTRPFTSPITSVILGGNQLKSDKIFTSQGQMILGVTKKGKEFFKLTSTLTETISNLIVEENRIWIGCEFILNIYDDGKDSSFYMSRDQINALVVDHISNDHHKDSILGCQDGILRVIQDAKSFLEIPLGASITSLANLHFDVPGVLLSKKEPVGVVFGLVNGKLGVIRIDKLRDNSHEIIWEIPDEKKSPITQIKVCDISRERGTDFVIGRDDGRVEVFSTGADSGEGGNFIEPEKVFVYDLGETVCGLDVGFVNSTDYQEIVVACFSGKIVSFTSEPVTKRAQDDTYGRSIQKINDENRIKNLTKEIEQLKSKINQEREKLKKASSVAMDQVKYAAQDFNINSRFLLDEEYAAYSLSFELQSPIDIIVIRSAVTLSIMDHEQSNCTIYITPKDKVADESSKYIATCKIQNDEKRMTLLIRSTEGTHSGYLECD